MKVSTQHQREQIQQLIKELSTASWDKSTKRQLLLTKIDQVSRNSKGMSFLYEQIEDLDKAGIFEGTVWDQPKGLVPTLVKGTLIAGFPTNVLEMLSELRMLRIADGQYEIKEVDAAAAKKFLEETIVSSFDLAYGELPSPGGAELQKGEIKRIKGLFDFIFSTLEFPNLKKRLADEVEAIAAQRPISTYRLEAMLELISQKIVLRKYAREDRILMQFVNAAFYPTPKSREVKVPENYVVSVVAGGDRLLRKECKIMGESMHAKGLVSEYHIAMVQYLAANNPKLIPLLLRLNNHGTAEFEKHMELVLTLIENYVVKENKQVLLGLKRLLHRTLLSRKPVLHALQKLMKIKIHPEVKARLSKKVVHNELDPMVLLIGGTISILGQPLGIGQGQNPTCQSARGISMWSQHSPGKLLNLIIDGALSNKLNFRYEGELMTSDFWFASQSEFDFDLDPVSIVLVPLLDSVYGKMMNRAMLKHPSKDPHVSVNPAFYGNWIQTGFKSCYNIAINAITDFEGFVRTFYAAFHPQYNGGHLLIYPVPIGIFITDSKARMLGYHAISLLQVNWDDNGELRAYFFNPNNEGRQDWGQGIKPTVSGHKEAPGESSLPFHEFVARVYAFHYNSNGIENRELEIPISEIKKVESLALESWGRKYIWL